MMHVKDPQSYQGTKFGQTGLAGFIDSGGLFIKEKFYCVDLGFVTLSAKTNTKHQYYIFW